MGRTNVPLPPELGTTGAPETTARPQHRKAIIASIVTMSLAGGVAGSIFGNLVGRNEQINADQARLARADREKDCLAIVLKNTKPGQSTAVVRLASLTPEQRRNCSLQGLAGDLQTGAGSFAPKLGAEIIGSTVDVAVRLPKEETLRLDIGAQEMRSEDPISTSYSDITIGAITGLLGVAGIMTAGNYPRQTAKKIKTAFVYIPNSATPLKPEE